jgi:hypothetical protein
MHKWLKAIVGVFTGLVLAMGFGTHAFGIGMTVLPNGNVMFSDLVPGTSVSNVTEVLGQHGDFKVNAHFNVGPKPPPGDNTTFTEIITPRIINGTSNENTNTTSDNTNETQPQQQQYNAGSTVSNVTGNATGGHATFNVGPAPVNNSNFVDCSRTDLTQNER